jgi:D-amino-acid oxidase
MAPPSYVILGAGVIGLTTALELRARHPHSHITIIAKYLPGDHHETYTSPWAGANWLSVATDNGIQESWDRVTYLKFKDLATGKNSSEVGIYQMPITAIYDSKIEEAGVLSQGTRKIWYEDLVGGIRMLGEKELPEGANFGCDLETFVVDTQVYLPFSFFLTFFMLW